MKEECLESVVFANLDTLFPGEALLPIRCQDSLMRDTDILAIDPLGCLRVFELKKQAVQADDLRSQAFSYALAAAEHPMDHWKTLLAMRLPSWYEELRLARLGVSLNIRTKVLGPKFIRSCGVTSDWDKLNRFEKLDLLARLLEEKIPKESQLSQAGIDELFQRTTAGLMPHQLLNDRPTEAAIKVLDHWAQVPFDRSLEIIVAGPQATQAKMDQLDSRNVNYALIDTILKGEFNQGVLQSAYLTWTPVRRPIVGIIRARVIELQQALSNLEGLHLRLRLTRFTLRGRTLPRIVEAGSARNIHTMLSIVEGPSGIFVETESDSLTEGLNNTREQRKVGLKQLKTRYAGLGVEVKGSGPELIAPLSTGIAPFVHEYFELSRKLGMLEPTSWFQRPG
jgi:hypothetical protein